MYDLTSLKKRVRSVAIAVAASGMVIGNVASVSALSASSLSLSDSRPSQTAVTYTFDSASFNTGTAVKCISLDFNEQADGLGAVPAGLTTTAAALDVSGTLITETNWTASFAANGSLDITYATGEIPASTGSLVYTGVTNGSGTGTHFAILHSYTNVDCATGPVDTTVVAYVYTDGTAFSVTIDPTLTFTVAGVAAAQAVNGATTTHLSTAASVDYLSDVNATTNGISAHDLQISSNASGGYTVYIRETAALTNTNGDTITAHTGTNLAPTTMSTGAEAWGYTTQDTTLTAVGNGANRFTTPANGWAGFTTSNEEVVYNPGAPAGTETTRVGHQVAVSPNTEAGTYTTTIVYTVVATF